MYQSTLIVILSRFFFVAFIIGTILLLVRSIKSYKAIQKSDKSLSLESSQYKSENGQRGKFRIIIKSAVAFILWFLFSLYIFALDFINSVGNRVGAEPLVEADSRNLGIIGAHILWFLAGILLIYWLGKMPKPAKLR